MEESRQEVKGVNGKKRLAARELIINVVNYL